MGRNKTSNARSNFNDDSPSTISESMLNDVRKLILESEQRILSKLENIVSRMNIIDEKIDKIATEQLRLDSEIQDVKKVVISQQRTLEEFEREKRQLNLIFSGVPEATVHVGDEHSFTDDEEKINFLCDLTLSNFDSDSIESCTRLGKPRSGSNRLLKVKFTERSVRNAILFSQKIIREDNDCATSFGRVYINQDSSPLYRKEEKRLRVSLHEKRRTASPDTNYFIKSGKLFCNGNVIDHADIANQLF